MQFGWGGFLIGSSGQTRITISHDEWILVESDSGLDGVTQDAEKFSLSCKTVSTRRTLNA
jgi:hypothetical protein